MSKTPKIVERFICYVNFSVKTERKFYQNQIIEFLCL